jgi:hypothetical protein
MSSHVIFEASMKRQLVMRRANAGIEELTLPVLWWVNGVGTTIFE